MSNWGRFFWDIFMQTESNITHKFVIEQIRGMKTTLKGQNFLIMPLLLCIGKIFDFPITGNYQLKLTKANLSA